MSRQIDDHADDVYVNVSAGSKITAIAGTIACMATGATPTYARPDYGPDDERVPDEPLHEAVAETFSLPTYPIGRPSREHVAVLQFVAVSTAGREKYVSLTEQGENVVRAFDSLP